MLEVAVPSTLPVPAVTSASTLPKRYSSLEKLGVAALVLPTSKMFIAAVTLLASALLATDPACGQETLSCPCGTTGRHYTFRNIDLLPTEEACETWNRCLKCQDEVYYCLECPDGMFGPSCSNREINPNLCFDPGLPLNGLRKVQRPRNHPQRHPAFPRGTHLKFSCKEHYSLDGWDSLVCLSGGKWSSATLPNCIKNMRLSIADLTQCSNPGIILNGRKSEYFPSYLYGFARRQADPDKYLQSTVLTYFCDSMHEMQGIRKLTCESTGFWSAKRPKCVEDRCQLSPRAYQIQSHGYHAAAGEWPFMVGMASLSNGSSRISCGGVLVNNRTVLTTASCFLGDSVFQLLFGKYRGGTEDDDDQVIKRTNFTVTIHPNFNNRTYGADIALVHFWPSMNYTELILPVCYPTNETTVKNLANGQSGYVTSWALDEDSKTPDTLVMSRYSVVTPDSCLKEHERITMEPETFCAKSSEVRADVCYGGSPMVFFDPRKSGYIVEGLVRVENSSPCNRPGRHASFTRVLSYVPWILENLH